MENLVLLIKKYGDVENIFKYNCGDIAIIFEMESLHFVFNYDNNCQKYYIWQLYKEELNTPLWKVRDFKYRWTSKFHRGAEEALMELLMALEDANRL